MGWSEFEVLTAHFRLPVPHITRTRAQARIGRGYPREEPGAGNPPARICEGESQWLSYSTAAVVKATAATWRASADGVAITSHSIETSPLNKFSDV